MSEEEKKEVVQSAMMQALDAELERWREWMEQFFKDLRGEDDE